MNTIYLALLMLGQALNISFPSELGEKIPSFEPSAALYLSDLDMFLISSDDTTKKDEALLFLMNAQGEVEEEPLAIEGLTKMTDIESVSMDGHGFLYVMSSLGLNKNGKFKSERNLFVRAERQDREIQAVDEMDLRTPLIEALESEHHGVIAGMSGRFEQELDVESHFTRAGKLFVGLKNPQPRPGQGVVLSLGEIDELFASSEVTISDVTVFDFNSLTGEADQISEIAVQDGVWWILTTIENGDGRFWRYTEQSRELELLQEFPNLKGEGLALRPQSNQVMIVFDEGGKPAKYVYGFAPY